MKSAWFKRDDWPLKHELQLRSRLMSAVRSIPGGDELQEDDVEWKALSLWQDSLLGFEEELPRNRGAAQNVGEMELRKLWELSKRLEDHIKKMHRPAIDTLRQYDCDVFSLATDLHATQEAARVAFSEIDLASQMPSDNRTKICAAVVADGAAIIYHSITGNRPGFTTDPVSNQIGGYWPEFLREVYSVLRISASVESQVKQIAKSEMFAKMGE